MFGLSWGQIIIIVLVGLFVLGPERIPVAVQWCMDGLKKVRGMAQGAQAQLHREIGPELEELRRQVADLQALREVQELRSLRDLNPRKMLGNAILGPENAGKGLTGFLGLDPNLLDAPGQPGTVEPVTDDLDAGDRVGAADQAGPAGGASSPPPTTPMAPAAPVQQRSASRLPPASVINAGGYRPAAVTGSGTNGTGLNGTGLNGAGVNGAANPAVDLAKSAVRVPEPVPFDPDGT